MRYEDRIRLHAPESLEFESGVERQRDGVFHVAVLTPMPGARAEMIALGHVKSDLLGGLVQAAGNTSWLRRRVLSYAGAQALEAHCHEEMTTLGRFLPQLYSREKNR